MYSDVFFFFFGGLLKYKDIGSLSFIFPISTNFKLAVAVNCLVLEPISKMVLGLFVDWVSLFAIQYPLLMIISPFLITAIAPAKPFSVPVSKYVFILE